MKVEKECRHCHRRGHKQYRLVGTEWECTTLRACAERERSWIRAGGTTQ